MHTIVVVLLSMYRHLNKEMFLEIIVSKNITNFRKICKMKFKIFPQKIIYSHNPLK
jgi:hypothetical protein